MSTINHYDQGDLALFAMQLLPRVEQSTIALHITDCTYCRLELAQLQGDLAAYAHAVDMRSPPVLVRERLLNQIARDKKSSPVERTEKQHVEPLTHRADPSPRVERGERAERTARIIRIERAEADAASVPTFGYPPRGQKYVGRAGSESHLDEDDDRGEIDVSVIGKFFTRVFPWMGWAAAAGLAIVGGKLSHQCETQRIKLVAQAATIDRITADSAGARRLIETITDPFARQVTLIQTQGESLPVVPNGRVTYIASKGALIFLASNLEPVQAYKTYELWLIPIDGRDPIPAGTFHPDTKGNASVVLPPLPKGIEAKSFGITVEDNGGSQTPTMPILLAGS